MGVKVGRGKNVEDAAGANAVCANELVEVGCGVSVTDNAVAPNVVDVADTKGVFVGTKRVAVMVAGEVVLLDVGMMGVDVFVLVIGTLANPCCRSCASCAIG